MAVDVPELAAGIPARTEPLRLVLLGEGYFQVESHGVTGRSWRGTIIGMTVVVPDRTLHTALRTAQLVVIELMLAHPTGQSDWSGGIRSSSYIGLDAHQCTTNSALFPADNQAARAAQFFALNRPR